MRIAIAGFLLTQCGGSSFCQNKIPGWFQEGRSFCQELATRTNIKGSSPSLGRPKLHQLSDYPARPISPPRSESAVVGKYDWDNKATWDASIRAESAKGPDFAGRFVVMQWSCGTSCSNAALVDTLSHKTHKMPFVGVVGCPSVAVDRPTIQRRADSNLLIVRGSLEITFARGLFSEGPCGTFYYLWSAKRFRLIGCEIPEP